MNKLLPTILCLSLVLTFAMAQAAPRTQPTAAPATQPAEDHLSVTQHEIMLHGSTLHYEATAGTLAMKDDDGKPKASFFFVSYKVTPAGEPTTRPITFVFNGGPGAGAGLFPLC